MQAPDKPTYIDIEFEKGDPVAIDGVKMSPATILTALNKVAGDNGIGRVDIVESRFVGEGMGAIASSTTTEAAAAIGSGFKGFSNRDRV